MRRGKTKSSAFPSPGFLGGLTEDKEQLGTVFTNCGEKY